MKDIKKGLIDLSLGTLFGATSIGLVNESSIPSPIKNGIGGLIGMKLIKGASDLIPKK